MAGYMIALGWDVATDDLTNFEDLFYEFWNPRRRIAPKSFPVREFPVETKLQSGRIREDGRAAHALTYARLPMTAIQEYITTYFVDGADILKSVEMTGRFRRHDFGGTVYSRYNCFGIRPEPGIDYREIDNGWAVDVQFRYERLVRLVSDE